MKELASVFKALSDETRLAILQLITTHGELCVCEIEETLGITESKASRHLRYLRNAGLLEDRREGLRVHYGPPPEMDPDRVAILALVRDLLNPHDAVPQGARQ